MKKITMLHNTPATEETRSHQSSTMFSLVLILVFFIFLEGFSAHHSILYLFFKMTLLEFIVLSLATFRLTRLFVGDKIMQWFRDVFLNVSIRKVKGKEVITRKLYRKGVRRQISLLLDCPWCVSIWTSLFSLFLWVSYPGMRFFFYVAAFSGAALIFYRWMDRKE